MAKSASDTPRKSMYLVRPEQVSIIGLDTDHQSVEEHPLWNPGIHEALDPAMVANVVLVGVDLPITIHRVSVDGNGEERWEVVDGRTRVRCARAASDAYTARHGEELFIPAIHLNGTDDLLFDKMVRANLFRKVTSPIERATYAANMLARNQPEETVAVKMGVDLVTLRSWMQLLEADAGVKRALDEGVLGASAAIRIAKLPQDAQRETLTELLTSGAPVTFTETRRAVNRRTGRGDGIGVTSRKVLRRLRDMVDGPDEGEGDEEYRRGFVEALNLSLGGGKVSAAAKRWLEKASKKPDKVRAPKNAASKKPRKKAKK